MLAVDIPLAFLSGVIAFFAPCVLPLLPVYISYVFGVSTDELERKKLVFSKRIFFSGIFYILGFTTVFVLLGTTLGTLGILVRRYQVLIQRLGGLIILFFGLEFSGIIKTRLLRIEKHWRLPAWADNLGYIRPFLLGVVFAATWTPCIGAVLGVILTLAVVSGTAQRGAILLFFYSLGLSVPFLLVSLMLASVPRYLSLISKRIRTISMIMGVILVAFGVLLLTDTYKFLNAWLFAIAYKFGFQMK
jgi:cytochrome c-type biogenesis protein